MESRPRTLIPATCCTTPATNCFTHCVFSSTSLKPASCAAGRALCQRCSSRPDGREPPASAYREVVGDRVEEVKLSLQRLQQLASHGVHLQGAGAELTPRRDPQRSSAARGRSHLVG